MFHCCAVTSLSPARAELAVHDRPVLLEEGCWRPHSAGIGSGGGIPHFVLPIDMPSIF
jgi:hypothetical protein